MQPAVANAASEDRDVLELLRSQGREPAFERLLPRYERKVYRLCCALLHDQALAQDAAQESLVRIWKALPNYDGRAALSSWIYAITRNRCLSAIERRRARSGRETALEPDELERAGAAVLDDAAAEQSRDGEQRAALLRELIDSLPERYRRTLLLFYFEQQSVAEVAAELGQPAGTVKTNLFRARAALTELLRQRGLDDPNHWLESGA